MYTRDLPRTLSPLVPSRVEHDTSPVPAASAFEDFDEPPLPLAITDAEGRPAAVTPSRNLGVAHETDEDKAARARIPSWDDILLGVRRKDD